MRKLYDKNIPKACEYCVYGVYSTIENMVVCEKKGFREPQSHCFFYKYDIFKRKPKTQPLINTEYDKEDFEI
ncbi:MAG: hypothetical protein Q4E28_00635 [Clostridia bacterium]|nr:hypothetical protein [Clostridia bacterium]